MHRPDTGHLEGHSAEPGELATEVRARRHLPVVAGFAALTAWALWPAITEFRTRAMADPVDGAMFTWLWKVMPEALLAGESPYKTDLIFHPVGADLALTTGSPFVALVTWPIRAWLGSAAQINALQLGSMFLTALATYFLALRVCRHRGAAFVAGSAYALLPGRFVHVGGHLNLIETGVIPFGLLLFLRFVDRPTIGRSAALGGGVGAAFLIDPQLSMFLLIGLLALAVNSRAQWLGHVRTLVLAVVIAGVIAAPLLVPMAVALASGGLGDPDPTGSTLQYSSSPLSWVVPPLDRLWTGPLGFAGQFTPNWEGTAYVGLVLLGLAIAGRAITQRTTRRGWVAIALLGFALSLGPYLFAGDVYVRLPLPYWLLRAIPGVNTMRVPGRFAMLGALGVYMLAAAALADLARRSPRRGRWLVAAVGLLSLVELFPRSAPLRDDTVSRAYDVIAEDTTTRAVLEVPIKWSTTQDQIGFAKTGQDFTFLIDQLRHGHPIVSGAVSRYPADALRQLRETPVYREVLSLADQPGFDDPPRFDAQDLRALGIGFVVYHRDDPVPRALRYFRSLNLPVASDDGTVIVWAVGD